MKITPRSLHAREILDSRGQPTVEVTLTTDQGTSVASVPSGASVGVHEAHELRDGDISRFGGAGVQKAVAHINEEIARAVCGTEHSQQSLDEALIALDGTADKSNLGANAMLAVSIAFARATAAADGKELFRYIQELCGKGAPAMPQPCFNVINGGVHADSGLSVQEFMLVPTMPQSMKERVRIASDVISQLKLQLQERGLTVSVGDEGGFAPKVGSEEAALDVLIEAIAKSGHESDGVSIALDVAATEFFDGSVYKLGAKTMSATELSHWYKSLTEKYPIVSIEDPFEAEAFSDFAQLREALGGKVRLVGDDLTVTNTARVAQAAASKSIDAVIIKPNQIGTVTETLAAAGTAKENGIALMVSHRSGETTDTFVADLAVGLGAEYCKFGSLRRGERVSKYNRLMEIEGTL